MALNQNGQLILNTLVKLEEPATVNEILSYVAYSAGVQPVDIQECVETTLEGGLAHGFVQCRNKKYFATHYELDSDAESDSDSENEDAEKTEMDDRSRRRRRGGRAKSHRSRSPRRRSRRSRH